MASMLHPLDAASEGVEEQERKSCEARASRQSGVWRLSRDGEREAV